MSNASNINVNERQPEPCVMADYISRVELAKQLQVTHRTLELWAHRRKGPRPVLIGRRSFYHVRDVAQWLDAQHKAATQVEPRSRRVAG